MAEREEFDSGKYSFEQFVSFLFAHDPAAIGIGGNCAISVSK